MNRKCPECSREWVIPSEQAIAIARRGMCIVCLTKKGIRFDPKEFQLKEGVKK